MNPSVIDDYIVSEQAAGRYSVGFLPADLEDLIGPFRTSPLGLVPKPHSTKLRIVQDMSFPRNDPSLASVNAGIDSDEFPCEWGTFDETAALILSLPAGCVAATFDISAAYRITPVRPDQQNALCIFWRGLVYVDRAVMFGLSSSAGVFGSVADMLAALYRAADFGPLQKWVDDFFVIRLPHHTWSESDFMEFTTQLGVPWSTEKLRPFATIQRYIGFDWDLASKTVALPTDKLDNIILLINSWLAAGAKFSESEAHSLHGKLVHVSCIFRLIRPFLRSISTFASSFISPRARLRPPARVLADLPWILRLLHSLPPHVGLCDPTPIDLGWWGDASTSFGIGLVIGHHWAAWRWAPGIRVGPRLQFDIGWAEAVAVEMGLRLASHLGLLQGFTNRTFLVRSDNSGIVTVTRKGRSRSATTNTVLKHLYALQASLGVRLHTTYVTSETNIADALSRGDVAAFLANFPSVTTKTSCPLPAHLLGSLIPL